MSTHVGFAGGHVTTPTYQQVCTKQTGHAEVVRVVFDKRMLPFQKLLEQFFSLHNPTIDRRDNGGQYRSVIFFPTASPMEERIAKEMLQYASSKGKAFFTELQSNVPFFPAEGRHQQYCTTRSISPTEKQGITPHFWEEMKQSLKF